MWKANAPMEEKRKYPRTEINEPAYISSGGSVMGCVVRNISPEGAAVDVAERVDGCRPDTGGDRTRVERLSREKQPVTADTAARLARVFGNTPQFWMNLQSQHDLSVVEIAERDQLSMIHVLPQMARRDEAPGERS